MYRQLLIGPEFDFPENWGDPEPHIRWGGRFDERTFGGSNYLFPNYNYCDTSGVVEWDCPKFRCYNDSELSINETNGEECNPTGVNVEELFNEREDVLLFPNPIRFG